MQKRDDKVGEKTRIKKEKKGKKRAREKGRNRFAKSQILAIAQAWKTKKKLFNYVRLVGNMPFFFTKLVFSHSYAN